MNLKHYLAQLIVFFTSAIYAQTNIPVDLTSGRPHVSIPLATITDRGLSLPVSLSYNAKGVKVTDIESGSDFVGINWSLNAGGRISRKVNGLPDDYMSTTKKGWLMDNTAQAVTDYTLTSDNSQATCTDEAGDWNQFSSANGFLLVDTEPDEFIIQLPGKSVNFVFDKDKVIRTLSYEDIKIIPYYEAGLNTQLVKFDVITSDGIKYVFEDHEYTLKGSKLFTGGNYTVNDYSGLFKRDYYFYREITEWDNFYKSDRPGVHYISSWYLTKIISPQQGKISLAYESIQNSVDDTVFNSPLLYPEDGWIGDANYTYATREQTFGKRVKEISAESGDMIYFGLNNQGLDKVCKNVLYYKGLGLNKRELSRTFSLEYYFTVVSGGKGRTFLKSVQESAQCNSFPPYRFDYFGVFETSSVLPRSNSDKVDYWNYFRDDGWTDEYNTRPPELVIDGVTLIGANRDVNPSSVTAGALVKVIFPPGGSAEFQYEPNTYWDGTASVYGPGLRIKKLTYHDDIASANNRSIEYNYNTVTGQSSGHMSYPTIFAIKTSEDIRRSVDNLGSDEDVSYQRVTVTEAGRGKTVNEYLAPPVYPQTSYDLDPSTPDDNWAANQIKFARHQLYDMCVERSFFDGAYYQYPFAKNPNYDFSSPLLQKKTIFNESGAIEQEHHYDYQRLPGTPIKVKGIHADFTYSDDLYLGEYYYLTNTDRVIKSEKIITHDPTDVNLTSERKTEYFYESGHHRHLSRTTTQNSDGSLVQTKIKYVQDYPVVTAGDEATSALQRMQASFINVPVETIESVIRSGTEKVTKATLFKFKYSGTTLPGLLDAVYELPVVQSFSESNLISANSVQSFAADPNYVLAKKVEEYDDAGNPLTISDGKKFKQSFHWGYDKRLPVAEISNASWSDIVYNAGEESPSTNEFDSSDGVRHLHDGIIGASGTRVSWDYYLEKTIPMPKGKKIRFSCRLLEENYGDGAFTVNFLGLTSGSGFHQIEYYNAENWVLIDTILDVSDATGPLLLTIHPGADDITLDDLIICPADASIKTYAYNPVLGKTSETGSRRSTVFYEYDNLGRIRFIKDRDKNILKEMEYNNKYDVPLAYTSDFGANRVSGVTESSHWGEFGVYAEDTWLFTPVNLCTSEVTHSWYVNGTLLSTANVFQYKFPAAGTYTIKHKAIHPVHGEKITEKSINVQPATIKVTISNTGSNSITRCAYEQDFNNANRTFDAQVLSGTSLGTLTYTWYYIKDSNPNQIIELTGWWQKGSSILLSYAFSYKVFCEVSYGGVSKRSNVIGITYYDSTDCTTTP